MSFFLSLQEKTVTEICTNLINGAIQATAGDCFTFECAVRSDGARKRRAADGKAVTIDIFLVRASGFFSNWLQPSELIEILLRFKMYGRPLCHLRGPTQGTSKSFIHYPKLRQVAYM